MTAWEMTITIGAVVLGTMATRFISFVVLPSRKTAGHRDVLRRYVAGRRYGALGGVFVKGCIALGSAERHSGGHCFGNIGGRSLLAAQFIA